MLNLQIYTVQHINKNKKFEKNALENTNVCKLEWAERL